MKTGLIFLTLGYVLSQFYRAFLAVLAPSISADTGASANDLALSSGLWFLAFAAMQLPVGWALDRIGPRRTAAWLLGLSGSGGAVVFAAAQGSWSIHLAMILIGIGCSPVLMASYYIFARMYPAGVFATLAAAMIGLGTLGNLASALPLAVAAEAFGWRGSVLILAAITLLTALALGRFIEDPPKAPDAEPGDGSLLDLLRNPAILLILPILLVNYAPAAGLRGLWVGPYYVDVFGASSTGVGQVTLLMGIAMVAGSFAYGPLDRLLGTRKWVVLVGNLLGAACLMALWAAPEAGFWTAALLLAGVGLFGMSFPMLMAHGRSFFPPHLVGRGVTLLNLFGIGGVGVFQLLSAQVFATAEATTTTAEGPYQALFLFFGVALLVGCAVYAFSRDRTD